MASYLVLNDVKDYRGFAATLAAVLKSGGRLVLALNNPIAAMASVHGPDTILPDGARFPRFTLLAFIKP